MKYIDGGVCAAKGFSAAGIHCGMAPDEDKNDLALIYCDTLCAAAGMFTTNKVKAAPVQLDIETIKSGRIRAIAANSMIANTCAPQGLENAVRMRAAAAQALNIPENTVIVNSTGHIGPRLEIEKIEEAMPQLAKSLERSPEGSDAAARGIMTTDTKKKELACQIEIDGRTVTIGGISKGSGMIHPRMGTMLCYVTTDCAIAPAMLQMAVRSACRVSFNRICVDGDRSTNDSFVALADGLAGNREIETDGVEYRTFAAALTELCTALARRMAADGEGARHLITCTVSGAKSEQDAEDAARAVVKSPLIKASIFGGDPSWGRIACAMGYSGADFDPEKAEISYETALGRFTVCRGGAEAEFDIDYARRIMDAPEVKILIRFFDGSASATCWGCDLTYDYVRMNAEYE